MTEPKIGLALGSGGARGFAHLGVLKILEEEGIPVHMIAGSSMGALVGSFYAAGLDIKMLYQIAAAFKRNYYLDLTIPKMGFIAGEKVKGLIRAFTKGYNIEDLKIPLAVVATDLSKGEKVIFTKGPVAEAVRASIAIPGIFVPEIIGGRVLVDGGVADRVPVSVARDMGADLVLSVDVSVVKRQAAITSIFDVILQSLDIMQEELVRHRAAASDLMMRPQVEKFSSRAFTNIQEIIASGEAEARRHLPAIHELIDKWKESHDEK
ncbi:patatin family protein [Bacillus mangrovi]|uniref:Patatin family protein n=1 Tax=Metabacillus mangrovi TaxID=1491830 RepID=A0A7X2S2Q5_9BACI|nr:patatin-like phospholipase family protein [Metabacillus mangrovi]MTH52614.1 patatin family protein [Metabacillus mangrovi]